MVEACQHVAWPSRLAHNGTVPGTGQRGAAATKATAADLSKGKPATTSAVLSAAIRYPLSRYMDGQKCDIDAWLHNAGA
jgi:hypothetical protein